MNTPKNFSEKYMYNNKGIPAIMLLHEDLVKDLEELEKRIEILEKQVKKRK